MYNNIFSAIASHGILNLVALAAIVILYALRDGYDQRAFNVVLWNLCLAVVASYVFYVITVDYKRVEETRNITAAVKEEGRVIIAQKLSIKNELEKYTKHPITFPCNEEQMKAVLRKVDPNKRDAPIVFWAPPGQLVHKTWLEYLYEKVVLTQTAINRTFRFMPFLDTKMIELLGSIEKSQLMIFLPQTVSAPLNNPDLEPFASQVCDYLNKIETFSLYYNKTFK